MTPDTGFRVGSNTKPFIATLVLSLVEEGVLVDGKTDLPTLCTPPEGFFTGVDADTVIVRFKGPVNGVDTLAPRPAIGNVAEQRLDELVPLYGLGAKATLKKQGLVTRLELESLAPGESKDAEVRVAAISLDPAWLDAITGAGDAVTDDATKAAVFYTQGDLDLVDGTLDPVKVCYTAVRDTTRPATVHLCDADAGGAWGLCPWGPSPRTLARLAGRRGGTSWNRTQTGSGSARSRRMRSARAVRWTPAGVHSTFRTRESRLREHAWRSVAQAQIWLVVARWSRTAIPPSPSTTATKDTWRSTRAHRSGAAVR